MSQQNTQPSILNECGILQELEAAGVPDVVCLGNGRLMGFVRLFLGFRRFRV